MKKKLSKEELTKTWMRFFEKQVIEQCPEFSGKIEWPSAYNYFYQGLTTQEAAKRYLEARKNET